jgi:DEAD/DEAH box helicase domain-containing protein
VPLSRSLAEVVSRWSSHPRVAGGLVTIRELPGRPADAVPMPATVDSRLAVALASRGVDRLWRHQAQVYEGLAAGRDAVIATPTASGKSLCYHLPVLDAILRDPAATAIYVMPTKALARDQLDSLRTLVAATGAPIGCAVFDGDTPADQRRKARSARVVATNPDMLHTGLLPHHASWSKFLAGLRYVVIDEVHTCRGLFGAGVANVIRRLRRVCAFYGAYPRFVATSATIANPGELATQVLGTEDPLVVTESGAPIAPRTFVLYNPPLVDSALGLRQSYLKTTERLTRDLLDAGVSTLVFTRSRRAVEILVHYLREDLDEQGKDAEELVRGYRGGYLPDRRRAVEAQLRSGQAQCVVSTSALELGIDVGGLDAIVLAGWPGSRAAVWQRAGRAGRRGAASLVLMVASSEPLDQYVCADPDFLFGEPPEHARVDPDNPAVLLPHLRCASFELPFTAGEAYGPLGGQATRDALRYLARTGDLHEDHDAGSFHWVGDVYPAQGVPLRGAIEENFSVTDRDLGKVIAEVDRRDAPRQLHENAIYALEGRLYQVERLDWDAHKAFVRSVAVDYTTDALTYTRVRILEKQAEGLGRLHVVEKVVGFKKIRLRTHENVGYGDVTLPPFELTTDGLWIDPPLPQGLPVAGASWVDAVGRAAYALHHVAALLVMCDAADLGRALGDGARGQSTALPRIFFYDCCPGGMGLTERLHHERDSWIARAAKLVEACPCKRGCPACVGALDAAASPLVKELTVRLLEAMRGRREAAEVRPC